MLCARLTVPHRFELLFSRPRWRRRGKDQKEIFSFTHKAEQTGKLINKENTENGNCREPHPVVLKKRKRLLSP